MQKSKIKSFLTFRRREHFQSAGKAYTHPSYLKSGAVKPFKVENALMEVKSWFNLKLFNAKPLQKRKHFPIPFRLDIPPFAEDTLHKFFGHLRVRYRLWVRG